jgi:hypothetical protein
LQFLADAAFALKALGQTVAANLVLIVSRYIEIAVASGD